MSGPALPRVLSVCLWICAFILMFLIGGYQRRTGPTYPVDGTLPAATGETLSWTLLRSHETGVDAPVDVPAPSPTARGTLHWRRWPTTEPLAAVPMEHADGRLAAALPSQPPAGKVEYRVEIQDGDRVHRLPETGTVVLRYKGAVPAAALIPHILFMFLAVTFGLRAGMEAIRGGPGQRWMTWATLVLLALGGLVLGPVVQWYAFGAAWTGVPFGWDLTDNKTLLMFLAWVGAAAVVGLRRPASPWQRRTILLACVLMLTVYLVPHSLFGSTLDYEQVDQGVDPTEAVEQG